MKTDNELLEEILHHTQAIDKSNTKIQGNTLIVALFLIVGLIATIALSENLI